MLRSLAYGCITSALAAFAASSAAHAATTQISFESGSGPTSSNQARIVEIPDQAKMELPWSDSPDSLQARLYQGLNGIQSDGHSLRRDDARLIVDDGHSRVTCESSEPSVQHAKYRCSFDLESSILSWSDSKTSAASILYDAMKSLASSGSTLGLSQHSLDEGHLLRLADPDTSSVIICQRREAHGSSQALAPQDQRFETRCRVRFTP